MFIFLYTLLIPINGIKYGFNTYNRHINQVSHRSARSNRRESVPPRQTPPAGNRAAILVPMPKHVVAAVDEIPPGGRKRVTVAGRAIVVFNLDGEFFALGDRCPHRGGTAEPGTADRPPRGERARRLPLQPARRDPPLPLAFLGVRHPHGKIVVRPRARARPPIRREGRARRPPGRGSLYGRDLSRSPSRRTTWWWRRKTYRALRHPASFQTTGGMIFSSYSFCSSCQ